METVSLENELGKVRVTDRVIAIIARTAALTVRPGRVWARTTPVAGRASDATSVIAISSSRLLAVSETTTRSIGRT